MTTDDINQRYRISDTQVSGELEEIEDLIPYRNGNGYFRNVVIKLPGGVVQPLLPITMFGTDATNLDEKLDLHRKIQCTARLTSRRYYDREGKIRWILSMSSLNVMLGPRPGETQEADPREDWPDDNIATGDPEDIPF